MTLPYCDLAPHACKNCPFTLHYFIGMRVHVGGYVMEDSRLRCSGGQVKRAPLLVIFIHVGYIGACRFHGSDNLYM